MSQSAAIPDAPSPDRARRRVPFVVLVLALLWPAQLVNASAVITAFAQAEIAQYFHTTQIAWFHVIYALVGTLLLPFAVKFSDMYGKRKVMTVLIVCGLVGDIICALASSYGVLLAGRAIAAGYVPVAALTLATARDVLPARRAATATGVIGATLGALIAVGPLIAGWLLDGYGFRGAMWFVTICTAVGLLLIATIVPETPRYAESGGFDWVGGLLLAASTLGVMYGIGQGSVWGWTDLRVLGLIGGGLVLLAVFLRYERSAAHPLLNLKMLSRREVATVLGATSVVQGTAFATSAVMTAVIPLYPSIPGISDGLGWTALHGATVGLPAGIVLFLVGIFSAIATRRFGVRATWLAAMPVIVLGLVLQAFFHHNATQLILTGIVAALGTGVVYGCTPILVMSAVSAKEQAQASGMSLMLVGLMSSLSGQILYTTLAGDATVFHGTTLYHDGAYRNGYFVLAGIIMIGLVISLLIPRLRRLGVGEVANDAPAAVAS